MGRKPDGNSSDRHFTAGHTSLAVVLQVRRAALQVLLWRRSSPPFAGAWALPGGYLDAHETLGHDVSPTNLQRVLLRRDVLEPTGARRASGRAGGRPGALFRFRERRLQVTDEFAVLRPRGRVAGSAP